MNDTGNLIRDAAERLEDGLRTVPDLTVTRDLAAVPDPPAAILGPPRLNFDESYGGPVSATFLVYLTVAFGESTIEQLWDLVPVVADAVNEVEDAAVTTADPGQTPGGQPAYLITVEVAL